MALYPKATFKLLPENGSAKRIVPTQIIYHTAVDAPGNTNLDRYFAREDVGLESHFWIPWSGEVVQMMDTGRQADANYRANGRAISIETEDDGNPDRPWTPAQLQSLIELTIWLMKEHSIPGAICPAWDAPGIGWHSLFGFRDPINQVGPIANPWSPSLGKTCPGRVRIRQIVDVIMPALKEAKGMKQEDADTLVMWAYRSLLKREPDVAGFDYWTGMLMKGMSPEQLRWEFMSAALEELAVRITTAVLQNVAAPDAEQILDEIASRIRITIE